MCLVVQKHYHVHHGDQPEKVDEEDKKTNQGSIREPNQGSKARKTKAMYHHPITKPRGRQNLCITIREPNQGSKARKTKPMYHHSKGKPRAQSEEEPHSYLQTRLPQVEGKRRKMRQTKGPKRGRASLISPDKASSSRMKTTKDAAPVTTTTATADGSVATRRMKKKSLETHRPLFSLVVALGAVRHIRCNQAAMHGSIYNPLELGCQRPWIKLSVKQRNKSECKANFLYFMISS